MWNREPTWLLGPNGGTIYWFCKSVLTICICVCIHWIWLGTVPRQKKCILLSPLAGFSILLWKQITNLENRITRYGKSSLCYRNPVCHRKTVRGWGGLNCSWKINGFDWIEETSRYFKWENRGLVIIWHRNHPFGEWERRWTSLEQHQQHQRWDSWQEMWSYIFEEVKFWSDQSSRMNLNVSRRLLLVPPGQQVEQSFSRGNLCLTLTCWLCGIGEIA